MAKKERASVNLTSSQIESYVKRFAAHREMSMSDAREQLLGFAIKRLMTLERYEKGQSKPAKKAKPKAKPKAKKIVSEIANKGAA